MDVRERSATAVGAAAALVLAVAAMSCLAVADLLWRSHFAGEALASIAFIAGWVLFVWGIIVGVVTLVALIRRTMARRPDSPWTAVTLAAGAAVMALTLVIYPLWGAGGGPGSAEKSLRDLAAVTAAD